MNKFKLHYQIQVHTTDIIPVLRVDVNFPDVDGYTALHYASIRGNCNVARELLQASADRIAQ